MLQTPHKSTPKRKRGDDISLSPIKFSFELSSTAETPEDGSNSPRSKVAHKFRGLALEGGGGAAGSDETDTDTDTDTDAMRKRHRPDEQMRDISPHISKVSVTESRDEASSATGDSQTHLTSAVQPFTELGIGFTVPQDNGDEATKLIPRIDSDLHKAYPSINRLSNSKSRVKKRASSPPLRAKRIPQPEDDNDEEDQVVIVDPVRAALTWHEDEITIYDPEDEDDDGTGVNGIGFKPTPALAHARAMRRRQQMAEYRKREESEARARRSQRRQRGSGISLGSDQKPPPRKVRFTDGEAKNIAVTTV